MKTRKKKTSSQPSLPAKKKRTHKIQFCAIRIDEIENRDQGSLDREYGQWAPIGLWSVYIVRPNQPSYVGALTPSSFAMHAYSDGELSPDAPEEIRAKLREDLMMSDHEDGYLDFRMVQGIIKSGKNALDLGMFVTKDETLDECRDAWNAALECLRDSRIL
jgi:hypothetical protein